MTRLPLAVVLGKSLGSDHTNKSTRQARGGQTARFLIEDINKEEEFYSSLVTHFFYSLYGIHLSVRLVHTV